MKHFEAVLCRGTLCCGLLHEQSGEGIVHHIINEVGIRQIFVGNGRAGVGVRVHADGGAIDNDGMVVDDVLRDFGIGKHARTGSAANVLPFYPHGIQTVTDGFAGASRSQDQGFAMVGEEEGGDAFGEADSVGVKAFEAGALRCLCDTDDIDGTNGACLFAQFVQQWNNSLLMRQCYVQSSEGWVGRNDLPEVFDVRNLEIEVLGINAFFLELIRKEAFAETMSKREADKAVCFHIFFTEMVFYFCARYMVQMPKVKRFQ